MRTRPLRSLWAWWRSPRVSDQWCVDQQRREFGLGVEQSVITSWPIDKARNEAGNGNRHRLRRRRI